MKRALHGILFFWLFSSLGACAQEHPIWSRRAAVLNVGPNDSECAPNPVSILSPNGRSYVKVLCSKTGELTRYTLLVRTSSQESEVPLDEGANELLWSPDSKKFFVNGGTSSYAGFFTVVYRERAGGSFQKNNFTNFAQKDMVRSFPPCNAWHRDGDEECKRIATNPGYNMSGIRWKADSSSIDVFAEVPCSSSYGGIMCQVKGYELNTEDGRIQRSYRAKDIPREWMSQMAWVMLIPHPPRYGVAKAASK